jgi:hypothetical protein
MKQTSNSSISDGPKTINSGKTAASVTGGAPRGRTEVSACPTPFKDTFATEGEARTVMRQMQRRSKRTKGKYYPVEPYKCRCGAVHLTSSHRRLVYGR